MNLWFSNTVSNLWADADNWFEDSGLATAHSAVPEGTDTCVILANCTLGASAGDAITVDAAAVLTISAAATLSGTCQINGGLLIAAEIICTVSGSMTLATAATLDGEDGSSTLKITGALTTGSQTLSSLIVQISATGEMIIPAGEVFTHGDGAPSIDPDDEGDNAGGIRNYGTLTLDGELDIHGLMDSSGPFNMAAGSLFWNQNDCNIRGTLTCAGNIIVGTHPNGPGYIAYLALQGPSGIITMQPGGTLKLESESKLEFYTFDNTATNVPYPARPAINFW